MSYRRPLAIAILVPFTLLTVYAVKEVGYVGIFDYQLGSPAGLQVLVDLVIACLLIFTWMIPEARRNGTNPWPWVALTLALGSFGPLLYLVFAGRAERTPGDGVASQPQ